MCCVFLFLSAGPIGNNGWAEMIEVMAMVSAISKSTKEKSLTFCNKCLYCCWTNTNIFAFIAWQRMRWREYSIFFLLVGGIFHCYIATEDCQQPINWGRFSSSCFSWFGATLNCTHERIFEWITNDCRCGSRECESFLSRSRIVCRRCHLTMASARHEIYSAGCRLIKQKPSNAWHTLSLIVFSPAFNDKHPSAENPFHSVHTGESANLYRHRLNYSVSKNRLSMGAPDDVSRQCQPPWVHSANIKDTSFTVLGTVNPLDIRFEFGMSIAFYVLHGLAIAVRSPFKLDDICWMHPVC